MTSVLACVYFWYNPDTFLAKSQSEPQALAKVVAKIDGCAG